MALTAASIAAITQDRGVALVDPATKSSIGFPVGYAETLVDGRIVYKFQISANINEFGGDSGCELGQYMSGSMSFNVQAGVSNAEIELLADTLVGQITARNTSLTAEQNP